MRNDFLVLISALSILVSACNTTVKPEAILMSTQRLNPLKDSIKIEVIHFDGEPQVTLLSGVQPIQLHCTYTDNVCQCPCTEIVNTYVDNGIVLLHLDDHTLSFPIDFQRIPPDSVISIDIRSPKTVIPDSALAQHQMMYLTDDREALYPLNGQEFFAENMLSLDPVSAIHRVKADEPLSSYYVQPGTVQNILLEGSVYDRKLRVSTKGMLTDRYGNVIVDGTKASFFIEDKSNMMRVEVLVLKGKADLSMDVNVIPVRAYMCIGSICSPSIELNSIQ